MTKHLKKIAFVGLSTIVGQSAFAGTSVQTVIVNGRPGTYIVNRGSDSSSGGPSSSGSSYSQSVVGTHYDPKIKAYTKEYNRVVVRDRRGINKLEDSLCRRLRPQVVADLAASGYTITGFQDTDCNGSGFNNWVTIAEIESNCFLEVLSNYNTGMMEGRLQCGHLHQSQELDHTVIWSHNYGSYGNTHPLWHKLAKKAGKVATRKSGYHGYDY